MECHGALHQGQAAVPFAGESDQQTQVSSSVAVAGVERHRAFGNVTKRGVVPCEEVCLSKLLPSQLTGGINGYGTPGSFESSLHWFFQRIHAVHIFPAVQVGKTGPGV